MNPTLLEQALKFRYSFRQPVGTNSNEVLKLQNQLIYEEFNEFQTALREEPAANQLKELADLVFVCFQYAAAVGWDLDTAMRRVYESNMSKLVDGHPIYRSDGKVLKGPNYKPPELDDCVPETYFPYY